MMFPRGGSRQRHLRSVGILFILAVGYASGAHALYAGDNRIISGLLESSDKEVKPVPTAKSLCIDRLNSRGI
ncbi:hypothetical protein Barb6_03653 [Bacteroidales bacterium Barb6]|nr:hypothetical protein Barb6_03653 [Bacteroidales bacterium Barb6]